MVRPVGVQNPNFSFCRVTTDGFKILLQKQDILQIHCQTHFRKVFPQLFFIEFDKILNNRNILRNRSLHLQSFRNFTVCKPAVHRIYKVMLNFYHFVSTYAARQNNHLCTAHPWRKRTHLCRILHRFPQKRKTLFRRISPLVVLPRKVFPKDYSVFFVNLNLIIRHKVALRFRKNPQSRCLRNIFRSIFNVVAVKITHSLYRGNAQKTIDFR